MKKQNSKSAPSYYPLLHQNSINLFLLDSTKVWQVFSENPKHDSTDRFCENYKQNFKFC